ncbi:hypothetical protein NEOKW01_1638 [Nematocida sp. AWRm80]|nr:hypothetical protein NEOKW01_1638 [Nematocida sp. AWRm80]
MALYTGLITPLRKGYAFKSTIKNEQHLLVSENKNKAFNVVAQQKEDLPCTYILGTTDVTENTTEDVVEVSMDNTPLYLVELPLYKGKAIMKNSDEETVNLDVYMTRLHLQMEYGSNRTNRLFKKFKEEREAKEAIKEKATSYIDDIKKTEVFIETELSEASQKLSIIPPHNRNVDAIEEIYSLDILFAFSLREIFLQAPDLDIFKNIDKYISLLPDVKEITDTLFKRNKEISPQNTQMLCLLNCLFNIISAHRKYMLASLYIDKPPIEAALTKALIDELVPVNVSRAKKICFDLSLRARLSLRVLVIVLIQNNYTIRISEHKYLLKYIPLLKLKSYLSRLGCRLKPLDNDQEYTLFKLPEINN